jgi:hypothetical protein
MEKVLDLGRLFGGELAFPLQFCIQGAELQAELLVLHPDREGFVPGAIALIVAEPGQQGMDAGPGLRNLEHILLFALPEDVLEEDAPAFQVHHLLRILRGHEFMHDPFSWDPSMFACLTITDILALSGPILPFKQATNSLDRKGMGK